jgi:hypothetical protein
MASMFGLPEVPVGDEAHGVSVRSKYSSHVIVAYPSPQDWNRLYQPQRTGQVGDPRQIYADMLHHHQQSVLTQLDVIQAVSSGRAVFTELSAAPHEVLIYPFDFQPSAFWKKNDANVTTIADTTAEHTLRSLRQGLSVWEKTGCFVAQGGGGRAQIFFTASRAAGSDSADEVLLHELTHAARLMRGAFNKFAMSGGCGNQEEFLAELVENVYRSEKGRPPIAYGGAPLPNPRAFLDSGVSPPPRTVIAGLRKDQPGLFAALAQIKTPFNPIRQVDLENKAYVTRIERG